MGQRHQVFLIAQVVPHGSTERKYRCIAAYHHQWCYGSRPLRAARRCITAIQQKDNARIIQEELRAMDGKYGVFWGAPELPAIPCPFASYLLCVSWDIDLALGPYESTIFSGAAHEGCIIEAHIDCWNVGTCHSTCSGQFPTNILLHWMWRRQRRWNYRHRYH